jgi:protein-disulfide isomerase
MKPFLCALTVCLSITLTAQTNRPRPATKPAAPAAPTTSPALPTDGEVSEFLRRMFGYDPNVQWKVQSITPGEAPGVAHVVAILNNQRAIHLYVLPGKKFAMVGEPIPFGSDPFAPLRSTVANGKGIGRGPAGAAVTIVEFSDLQCPFCKNAQPIIDRLAAEVPGVRLVFQPFPLPMHDWAMQAAVYGDCVGQQKPGAFWEFVNAVYADQANITQQNASQKLQGLAASAGVDAGQVSVCAEGSDVRARIEASIALGKSVGVNATPTIFINGRKVQGITDVPFEQLKAMVEFEVAEAAKQKASVRARPQ